MATVFQQALASGMTWSQAEAANRQAAVANPAAYGGASNPAYQSALSKAYGGIPQTVGNMSSLGGAAITSTPWAQSPSTTATSNTTTPQIIPTAVTSLNMGVGQPQPTSQTNNKTYKTYQEAWNNSASGDKIGGDAINGYYVIPGTFWNTRQTTTANLTPEQELSNMLKISPTPTPTPTLNPAVKWVTQSEGGWDFSIGLDKEGNVVSKDPLGRTETPTSAKTYPLPSGQAQTYTTKSGQVMAWDSNQGGYIQTGYDASKDTTIPKETPPVKWSPPPTDEGTTYQDAYGNTYQIGYDPLPDGTWDRNDKLIATKQPEEKANIVSADTQAMIDWYQRQQTQQLEADKQARLAQLAANPASWLEYAATSGQPPTVQPWMLPLGYEDYGFNIGAPLPGAEGGSYSGLPSLKTPSAQYMARLSPSARAQYYAYLQARSGQTPSDVQSYLWSMSPSGGTRQLSYMR